MPLFRFRDGEDIGPTDRAMDLRGDEFRCVFLGDVARGGRLILAFRALLTRSVGSGVVPAVTWTISKKGVPGVAFLEKAHFGQCPYYRQPSMCSLALRHWIGIKISLVKRRKGSARGHSRPGFRYPSARYQYACMFDQRSLSTKISWNQLHTFPYDQPLCSRQVLSPCAVFFFVVP